jgi:hypothetical protein
MSAEPLPQPPARARPRPPDPAVVAARVLPLRRALLHELRWRPQDFSWRRVFAAVVVAILAHVLLALLVRDAMRPKPFVDDRRGVIRVSLIELPPPADLPPAAQELPPLAVQAPPSGTARNAPAPPRPEQGARAAPAPVPSAEGLDGVVATPSAPSLYNADGSLRIQAAPLEIDQPQTPIERGKLAAEELRKRGHNVVRCKSTRFARAYTPAESLGEKAARKYGAYVGMYNPHTALEAANRAADAREDCDSQD